MSPFFVSQKKKRKMVKKGGGKKKTFLGGGNQKSAHVAEPNGSRPSKSDMGIEGGLGW